MSSQNKQGKMIGFINYRMRVTLKDGRQIIGYMLAFDKHMNLVLADTEEQRKSRKKAKDGSGELVEVEEKRSIGMAIIRGQEVVACTVDGPPAADPASRLGTETKPNGASVAAAGPGISRPAGRGAGLQGPAAGVGGGFPPFPGAPAFPPAFGAGPPGFAGRGAPPGGFPPFPPGGAPGFAAPPGFAPPPGGRGFPPPPGGMPPR